MATFIHLSTVFYVTDVGPCLLCSAVDQFRKQFAHLEENGGKSGPIPAERKHVSLPRCVIILFLCKLQF